MKQEYGLNYVTRRTFTHNGVAAMLAAGAAPAFVTHARADEPNKKLGMAVVGLGGYATRSVWARNRCVSTCSASGCRDRRCRERENLGEGTQFRARRNLFL